MFKVCNIIYMYVIFTVCVKRDKAQGRRVDSWAARD